MSSALLIHQQVIYFNIQIYYGLLDAFLITMAKISNKEQHKEEFTLS